MRMLRERFRLAGDRAADILRAGPIPNANGPGVVIPQFPGPIPNNAVAANEFT